MLGEHYSAFYSDSGACRQSDVLKGQGAGKQRGTLCLTACCVYYRSTICFKSMFSFTDDQIVLLMEAILSASGRKPLLIKADAVMMVSKIC